MKTLKERLSAIKSKENGPVPAHSLKYAIVIVDAIQLATDAVAECDKKDAALLDLDSRFHAFLSGMADKFSERDDGETTYTLVGIDLENAMAVSWQSYANSETCKIANEARAALKEQGEPNA